MTDQKINKIKNQTKIIFKNNMEKEEKRNIHFPHTFLQCSVTVCKLKQMQNSAYVLLIV